MRAGFGPIGTARELVTGAGVDELREGADDRTVDDDADDELGVFVEGSGVGTGAVEVAAGALEVAGVLGAASPLDP